MRTLSWFALVLAWALAAAASLAGCVATPLPEPPSGDPAAMTLVADQPDRVTLRGRAGAIRPGSTTLRVTIPRTAETGGRVEVPVAPDGAFDAEVAGAPSDVLFLEQVAASGDVFLLAVAGGMGDGVAVAAPGADRDGDGSPDAIDCAPDDRAQAGRDCRSCVSDAECDGAQVCRTGICSAAGCGMDELCANGLDDDCDGAVDEAGCI